MNRGGAGRHQLSNLTDGSGRGGAGLVLARPLPPLHPASVHDTLDLQRLGRLEEGLQFVVRNRDRPVVHRYTISSHSEPAQYSCVFSVKLSILGVQTSSSMSLSMRTGWRQGLSVRIFLK